MPVTLLPRKHLLLLILSLGMTWVGSAEKAFPQALLVVGSEPSEPLYADRIFKERLEFHGFEVRVIRDKEVIWSDCEKADAMLVSSSIGGGNVLHRLDNCTKPQIIWEVGIFQFNGMSGPGNADAWVTSHWWNTYHQDAWKDGAWPPAPTGKDIVITPEGSRSPLAAGAPEGMAEILTDPLYGMNWVYIDQLGPGAEIIGLLPFDEHLPNPTRSKATLFMYEKGAELYGGRGPSPALRIGFPPYGFLYGADPTCPELAQVPPCAVCQTHCLTPEQMLSSGRNPMPLSELGLKMLDAAIVKIGGKPPPPRALLVVGSEPGAPLYADKIFKERLEAHGFTVIVVRDKNVTHEDCENSDAMLVSSSIGGGNVLHRLDDCTKPQIIWEVGIFQFNGMSGPSNANAWVTSHWWNTYHQDAWKNGQWPPAPTGKNIVVTLSGFQSPLAAGALPGEVEILTDPLYGMNWVYTDQLGAGAQVIGLLPRNEHLPNPDRPKATLFKYAKGAQLYGDRGTSPALRIAFPPYGFLYGADPTCPELAEVPPCAVCQTHCLTPKQTLSSGRNPMPLSTLGLQMLDAAIVEIGGTPITVPLLI